jgi:PAS domain S-box-containing protein
MKQSDASPDYTAFKRSVVITVIALILLLIGFSSWKAATEYRLTVRSAEKQSRGYARALREHAERAISEADSLLLDTIDELKSNGSINREDSQRLRSFMKRHPRNMPQVGAIILVNRDGLLFAHSLETPLKQADVSDREYFLHHLEHPEDRTPFLSRPVKSRINGKWRFTLSRPVFTPSGAFDGLVAVAFEMDYFSSLYSSLDLGKKGRFLMIRKDGHLIQAEPFNEKDFSSDFTKSALIRTHLPHAPKGTYRIAAGKALLENDSRLVAYESLSTYPIVVLINMSLDETLESWRTGAALQAALTLAACAGLYLLMILLLRQIKRIQKAYHLQSDQQAEIASAASAWQTTFDSVADAIWVMDLDRTILRCNKGASSIFGRNTDLIIGHLCCEVAHSGNNPLSSCPFGKMLESGQRASVLLANGDRWLEVSVDPIRDKNGNISGAVHIVSDITELKQTEERAIESEAHMRGLLSAIPDAIFFKDDSGRWLLANDAGVDLFSLRNIEYAGKTDLELADLVPASREALQICRKSDLAAWEQHCLIQTEEIISDSKGKSHIFDTIKIPLYKPDGSRHGMIILGRDITDQRQLEMQLRQAQKMEAIGHLAGGIAHDFNNLLTPILGYAEMAAAKIPQGDALEPKLAGIITAAHKAKALTQQLLNFGRRQPIASEVIDLNEVTLSFNNILRRTIRESIRIDLELDPEGAFIKGDRSQLEQIILNMTVNAQDAFNGSQGRISIETCKMVMDGENARMHPGMVPGEYVLFSFRDNGCGMSNEVINHIFEPFFTTKQIGHGTGLGLATVYGIVKQHDAHISVISHEGVGTTFNIYFPTCTQVPLMMTRVEPTPHKTGTSEITILVVEDNEMVRDMVQEILTDVGYTVMVAADPHHAIELLDTTSGRIDLLVSDVVMPGMNGPELYEQLVVQIPALKVVYISGYPMNPSLRGGLVEEEVNYLQKPFTAEALLERIHMVL